MYHPTSSPKRAEVMQLLLAAHPALLSRDEIAREVEDAPEVEAALDYFAQQGLVHCLEGFVWASWSALAAEEVLSARLLSAGRD